MNFLLSSFISIGGFYSKYNDYLGMYHIDSKFLFWHTYGKSIHYNAETHSCFHILTFTLSAKKSDATEDEGEF